MRHYAKGNNTSNSNTLPHSANMWPAGQTQDNVPRQKHANHLIASHAPSAVEISTHQPRSSFCARGDEAPERLDVEAERHAWRIGRRGSTYSRQECWPRHFSASVKKRYLAEVCWARPGLCDNDKFANATSRDATLGYILGRAETQLGVSL